MFQARQSKCLTDTLRPLPPPTRGSVSRRKPPVLGLQSLIFLLACHVHYERVRRWPSRSPGNDSGRRSEHRSLDARSEITLPAFVASRIASRRGVDALLEQLKSDGFAAPHQFEAAYDARVLPAHERLCQRATSSQMEWEFSHVFCVANLSADHLRSTFSRAPVRGDHVNLDEDTDNEDWIFNRFSSFAWQLLNGSLRYTSIKGAISFAVDGSVLVVAPCWARAANINMLCQGRLHTRPQ